MNSKEEQLNSDNISEQNQGSKDKLNDSENINQKNEPSEQIKPEENSIGMDDKYKFGWGSYSEITNGRFAMIGFLAIILIELFSKQSFLKWAGIL